MLFSETGSLVTASSSGESANHHPEAAACGGFGGSNQVEASPGGRPRKTDMRAAMNAIFYLPPAEAEIMVAGG